MNATGAQQQIAQVAENALSGERSFETVQYCLTGAIEADLISAIAAVLNVERFRKFDSRSKQRLFEYLAALYKDTADDESKRVASWQERQKLIAIQAQLSQWKSDNHKEDEIWKTQP